ncbi:MAG TPA: hypothetical protein VFC76_00980 [Oscillospiraceae bacterium]|nr:hypothetical protein [Oscillospiraceae bacterium]
MKKIKIIICLMLVAFLAVGCTVTERVQTYEKWCADKAIEQLKVDYGFDAYCFTARQASVLITAQTADDIVDDTSPPQVADKLANYRAFVITVIYFDGEQMYSKNYFSDIVFKYSKVDRFIGNPKETIRESKILQLYAVEID